MRFLIDEMFPAASARRLDDLGHDAVHVSDIGLAQTPDAAVLAAAADAARALVTEDAKDFIPLARQSPGAEVVIIIATKANLPAQGMDHHLADRLHAWARQTPEPYRGLHWLG